MAQPQKQEIVRELQKFCGAGQGFAVTNVWSLTCNVLASKHILDNGHSVFTQDCSDAYNEIFDIIYREAANKLEAEAGIAKILGDVKS